MVKSVQTLNRDISGVCDSFLMILVSKPIIAGIFRGVERSNRTSGPDPVPLPPFDRSDSDRYIFVTEGRADLPMAANVKTAYAMS